MTPLGSYCTIGCILTNIHNMDVQHVWHACTKCPSSNAQYVQNIFMVCLFTIEYAYTVKQRWIEPTNLSPTAHQMGNWCVGGDNLAGSAHLCFYNDIYM